MKRSATISKFSQQYRYDLTREWDEGAPHGTVLWIMLNPSTADGEQDDPTIRRCIQFSQDWGHSRLVVCNLFAHRSTDPRVLIDHIHFVGPDNLSYIDHHAREANRVICAWGNVGAKFKHYRDQTLAVLLEAKVKPECLGITKIGEPLHPLYVRRFTLPVPYPGSRGVIF